MVPSRSYHIRSRHLLRKALDPFFVHSNFYAYEKPTHSVLDHNIHYYSQRYRLYYLHFHGDLRMQSGCKGLGPFNSGWTLPRHLGLQYGEQLGQLGIRSHHLGHTTAGYLASQYVLEEQKSCFDCIFDRFSVSLLKLCPWPQMAHKPCT